MADEKIPPQPRIANPSADAPQQPLRPVPPKPRAPAPETSPLRPQSPQTPPLQAQPPQPPAPNQEPPRPQKRVMPRPPARKPAPEYDAGHVPITEEFDSARRTLPPVLPVVIALVIVAVIVAILMYANRAKPAAQGGIDEVFASQMPDQPNVMVTAQLSLRNTTEKPLFIKSIHADLKTDQDFSDEAASPSDYDRYFAAFPDLREHSTQALAVETKIAPGALQKGTVIVSFPVTKAQFDARKDFSVTIEPYDQSPIVLKEKPALPAK